MARMSGDGAAFGKGATYFAREATTVPVVQLNRP